MIRSIEPGPKVWLLRVRETVGFSGTWKPGTFLLTHGLMTPGEARGTENVFAAACAAYIDGYGRNQLRAEQMVARLEALGVRWEIVPFELVELHTQPRAAESLPDAVGISDGNPGGWVCVYCGAPQLDGVKVCKRCAATKEAG